MGIKANTRAIASVASVKFPPCLVSSVFQLYLETHSGMVHALELHAQSVPLIRLVVVMAKRKKLFHTGSITGNKGTRLAKLSLQCLKSR